MEYQRCWKKQKISKVRVLGRMLLGLSGMLLMMLLYCAGSVAEQQQVRSSASEEEDRYTSSTKKKRKGRSAKRRKKVMIDFGDEAIHGSAHYPGFFHMFRRRELKYGQLIKFRENFLPEMRRMSNEIQEHQSQRRRF